MVKDLKYYQLVLRELRYEVRFLKKTILNLPKGEQILNEAYQTESKKELQKLQQNFANFKVNLPAKTNVN